VAAVLTGSCACGGVRLEVDAPLGPSVYCHCTRCQKRTGGRAGSSARVQAGSVRIVAGEELLSRWHPEGGTVKVFCSVCAAGLVVERPEDGEIVAVRLGAIDGDPGVTPVAHQYVAYASAWERIPDDGLPRFDEAAGQGDPR